MYIIISIFRTSNPKKKTSFCHNTFDPLLFINYTNTACFEYNLLRIVLLTSIHKMTIRNNCMVHWTS